MKITVLGAAGEVTGSSYLVQNSQSQILIDFGLFQGTASSEKQNILPPQISLSSLNAVVLTHGHLDHCGRLPLLTKKGFRGPIFATSPSVDICDLILQDSARLQMADAERTNRKRTRAGKKPQEPLYTVEDIQQVMPRFRVVPLEQETEVAPGLQVRFVEAGHILGSTSVDLRVQENGQTRRVVFSGDVGPRHAPLLPDPTLFHQADGVFLESTYGDRDHRPLAETLEEGKKIIDLALAQRGKVLVPVFAVGRAQNILYYLARLFRQNQIPSFPVYLDSPMAIQATKIYSKFSHLFDEEAQEMIQGGHWQRYLDMVQPIATAEESQALNKVDGPCLILAGSGMCNGGRILHHLRHNLYKPQTHVVFVGFQPHGSLGRMLIEGEKKVRIFGETVAVKASIHTLGGFSAHAGQTELLEWFASVAPSKPRLFLTHGEESSRHALGNLIEQRYGIRPTYPLLGQAFDL